MTDNIKWIYDGEYDDLLLPPSCCYQEWVSEDGKLCKRVWGDGEVEIFEIAT